MDREVHPVTAPSSPRPTPDLKHEPEDDHGAIVASFANRLGNVVEELSQDVSDPIKRRLDELEATTAFASAQLARSEQARLAAGREVERLRAALKDAAANQAVLQHTLIAARCETARCEAELALSRDEVRARAGAEEDVTVALGAARAHQFESKGAPGGMTAMQAREIVLLRRMLEAERRAARDARSALADELALRTEAQVLLRTCIDEARARLRKERQRANEASPPPRSPISAARAGSRGAAGGGAGGAEAPLPPVLEAVTAAERAALLAAILEQEAVLAMLPAVVLGGPAGARSAASLGLVKDDDHHR